jgi:type I restriction-modification system DNA methylase subunit
MARKEANFDLYIHGLLTDAGISATAQGSEVLEINDALKTATKKRTCKAAGYPEYTAVVRDFIIVMEDKPDRSLLVMRDDNGSISLETVDVERYALNGALHYASHIVANTPYKRVFAFGNAGDSKHHILVPLFVDESGYKELPEVETFENFSDSNIEGYYERVVLGNEPPEDVELSDILKKGEKLHEYLRNYGSLGEDEKPLVVSAILLALREQKRSGFSLNSLVGDDVETDGDILYKQLEKSLKAANVRPETKLNRVLSQFNLIKERPKLNEKRPFVGDNGETIEKTPLKFFSEYINENIFKAVISNSAEDFLGRFYGEFVSYSGGDGQALGVVLTPRHITELFCELVALNPTDVIFDPCCGTGGFLVSGMHKMLRAAKSDGQRKRIREHQIYGIEDREDMFAIATTNMILRGDGQSNLRCGDFFKFPAADLQIEGGGVTVGFMNPPYSQAKDKATAGLSELCFIRQLLNSVTSGGRVAVIVPVSAMIGKTKEDKQIKREILKHHTLKGVISLNKNTFYRVGTVPCAAVFTAGEPHAKDHIVKFINFEDDGFEVKKHLGLVETERAKDRRSYMLDCWHDKIIDAPSKFIVTTTIEDTDEWIHSFYYYNDEIPTEQDFLNSIADYLTFEFSMITHGRGYLFESTNEKTIGTYSSLTEQGAAAPLPHVAGDGDYIGGYAGA